MAFTVTTDLGEKTLSELDGLHNESQTTLEDLKNILEAIQTTITGMSTVGGDKMSKDVEEILKKTVGNEDAKEKDKGKPSDGGAAQIKPNVGLNDLNGLGANYVMGALLINSTLLDLQSRLDQIIQQMPTGKNAAKVAKENAKAAGGNKTVNKIDTKSFKDLAESLTIFAKAAVIMAVIPFPIVKMATKSFGHFIEKMVDCANKMGPNLKEFKQFAEGLKTIVNCLKTYSIAVILLALTLPLAPLALLNVLMMTVMIRVLGVIANVAKEMQPVLNDMVMAFIKIGVAMILYGVAMMIIVQVGKQALDALKGLLVMVTFLGALALLGFLCQYLIIALAPMMTSFILLGVAMILFSVALKLMEKIKVDQQQIDNVMLAIKTIATGFSSMIGIVFGALLAIVGFTLFSVLFTASVLIFTLGVLLLKAVELIMGKLKKEKDPDTGEEGFLAIILTKNLIKQFSNKATITSFLLGTVAMIPFLLFSALFAVGVLLFMLGAVFLLITNLVLEGMVDKDTGENTAVKYMITIAKQMGESAGWWLLGMVAMVPALIFAGQLAVFSVLTAIAAVGLSITKKELDKIGSLKDINSMGDKLREAGIGVMLGFLGVKHSPGEKIGFGDLITAGKNSIKMIAVGVLAAATILPMALFMIAAKQIGEAFVSLSQSMESVKPETIEMVFGGLSMVLSSLSGVAYALKDSSAETIEAIGGLVKNVAEAINLITDVVIKLKDGIPDEQIDAATTSMLHICERLFGRPGTVPEDGRYTLCTTLESIASADLQDLNVQAVEAIVPLMDGIDRMSDLVIKLSDPDTFNEEKIIQGVTNMGYFLAAMKDVSTAMMGLIKKEATGEVIAGKHFWNKDQPVYKSPLDAIQEVVDSGFFSTFNSVMDGMQSIGNRMQAFDVTGLQNFADFIGSESMLTFGTSAEKFQEGFGRIGDGLSNLNETMLNHFEKFVNVVTNAGNESFKSAVDNLIKLSLVANKFERIARALGSMADSMSQMAKKKKDIINIFEAIGDTKTDKIESVTPTNAANSVGGTTINPYVEKIYSVLMDWNDNGIPVKAQINNETGEITPVDANNSVGLGEGRT